MDYLDLLNNYRANNKAVNLEEPGIKYSKLKAKAFAELLNQYCEDLYWYVEEGVNIPQKYRKSLNALQKAFCFNAGADLQFALEFYKDSDLVWSEDDRDPSLADAVLISEEKLAETYSYISVSYEEGKEYVAFFDNIRSEF